MAETLKIFDALSAAFTSYDFEAGSRTTPVEVTVSGNRYDNFAVVADAYNVETLWTTGDGGVSDFTIGYLVADQDCLVELRDDAGTPNYTVLSLTQDVPMLIHGQNTKAGTSAILVDETQTTSFDKIDRIRAQRNAADEAGDANVRLVLFE